MESKLEDLSPELKAELKACETAEELEALAAKENVELSLDELEGAAGGFGRCDELLCNTRGFDPGSFGCHTLCSKYQEPHPCSPNMPPLKLKPRPRP